MGYQAVGVKLPMSALPKLGGPVLIHLAKGDYEHFVVLRGVRDDRVCLGDPIRGNVQYRIWRFDKEWTGTALVLGRKGFGMPQDHGLALSTKEPVQDYKMALRRSRHIPHLSATKRGRAVLSH
jgi:predicted double-glycine peptidase